MNDNTPGRCCTPEDAWASVEEMASGALKGTIKNSILVEFIEHALGVGPCLVEKMLDCLRRHSAIMWMPSLRRDFTYGVTESSLLTWAETMTRLALDEGHPGAAKELAVVLDDYLRLLRKRETSPARQREVKTHPPRGRAPTLSCQDCGPVEPRLAWKEMVDGRTHLGAYCRCDRWIKWVPQVDEWLRSAPAKETAWGVAA